MEQNWDARSGQGHGSDDMENQRQDQNNNGNIGREEAAEHNYRDQNPNERGQFGTTAEKGSGALDEQPQAYTDNEGLAREREKGQEGYNETENSDTYGRSQRETDQNWAQGSEGSPGKGYQDDYTSGRQNIRQEDHANRPAPGQVQPQHSGVPPESTVHRQEPDDDNNGISDDDRMKDELI